MLTLAANHKATIVNAAFLQEVKDSNLPLWSVLHDIREMRVGLADTRELSCQFVNQLEELRDCIGLQFSLEETYGFIDGAPHKASIGMVDASIAKTQHRELYLQLHELCEKAEEAQYRGVIARDLNDFLQAFADFDAALRAHEELESELIRCGLGIGFASPKPFMDQSTIDQRRF